MDRNVLQRNQILTYVFTVIVIGFSSYYIFSAFELSASIQTVRTADSFLFIIAILLFYITFPIRTIRWRHFLRNLDIRTNWMSANVIILSSFYLNILVPAKGGDVYRGYRGSTQYDASFSKIAGTVAAERVIDMILLVAGLIILLIAVLPANTPFVDRVIFPAIGLFLIIGAVISLLFLIDWIPLPERMVSLLQDFRRGLRAAAIGSTTDRATVVTLSLGIWGANIVRTAFVASALGIQVSIAEIALLALLIAFFSGLPYLPAGIGVVEIIGSQVLVILGLSKNTALAFVLLDRFITVVTLIVVGTVAYLLVEHTEAFQRLDDPSRSPKQD